MAEEPGSARYGLAQLVIDRRLGGVLAGLGDSTTALSRTTAAIARGERLSSGPSQENARMQVTLARVQAAAVLTARSDETAVAAAGLAAAALDSSPPRPASVAAVTCTDLADTYVTLESAVAAQERPPLLARARDLADAADAAWREGRAPGVAGAAARGRPGGHSTRSGDGPSVCDRDHGRPPRRAGAGHRAARRGGPMAMAPRSTR